jgi:orotidine-5'-phosphate decarboxylase
LTSNKGSADFQLVKDEYGERLFEKVLRISQSWANDNEMMYVVGATQGELFKDVRKIVPNHFLLVPGVGAQGGSLEEVCKNGMNSNCGLLVNSSRGIIYVDNSESYARFAGDEAKKLQLEMKEMLRKYLK